MTDIIRKYPIFNFVDSELIDEIKLACVFGKDHNALFITKNDKVYGIGRNKYGELGNCPAGPYLSPVLIECLSNLQIKQFVCGVYHVNALCLDGSIFSWGKMDEGQLGQRDVKSFSYPTPFISLTHEKVEQIACGYYHNVVLCKSGKVYSWGKYGYSSGTSSDGSFAEVLIDKEIISIACGGHISFALTSDGELYTWGENANYQISSAFSSGFISYPTKINISQSVEKVVSGKSYSLAVTKNGLLYGFGTLDQETYDSEPVVLKAIPEIGSITEIKFIDIAAVLTSNVLAVMDENLKIYILGCINFGVNLRQLCLTKFNSFHDVFATLATPSATYKNIEKIKVNPIMESLEKYFNDEETSDFSILVECKTIYVHKCILKMRNEYYRSMFKNGWKENCEKALLKYYYTNQLDVPYENVFELLELSRMQCEKGLTELCEQFIKSNLNPDNASSAYHSAKYLKFQELQDFCLSYIFKHFTAVALSVDFLQDSNTMDDIVKKAARHHPKLFYT